MKDQLEQMLHAARSPGNARNLAREYLQARMLGALQRAGAMVPLAFQGGTALRFLYRLPRFSEDMDFALEGEPASYDLRGYLQAIQSDFAAEGYDVSLRVSDHRAVHSAFVRFPGLPHRFGLSPHEGATLAIKIEVDTNPPPGARLMTTIVRRYVTMQIQHHDKASLLAGKLHAILQRPHIKGRDFYDLLWYLSDPSWPAPNLDLLNHALKQTAWSGPELTAASWRAAVAVRLHEARWDAVRSDVLPFLERPADADLLTLENLRRVLAAPA